MGAYAGWGGELPMTWQALLEGRASRVRGEEPGAGESTAALPMGQEAFAGFYERSARSLWAYLARAGGDAALADDLTQEAFVRFLCASKPQDGEVACRKYLFRIGTNLLKDHWRRPRTTAIDDVAEEAFSVEDGTGRSDSEALLGRALATMRPRDRQILWLAYAEDYTHKEIAEITGLGSTSIRLLLFRARKTMAERLRAGGR